VRFIFHADVIERRRHLVGSIDKFSPGTSLATARTDNLSTQAAVSRLPG